MYPNDMVFDIFNGVKGGLHVIKNGREVGDRSQSLARVIFRHLFNTSLKAFIKVTYNWRLEGTRTSCCSKLQVQCQPEELAKFLVRINFAKT